MPKFIYEILNLIRCEFKVVFSSFSALLIIFGGSILYLFLYPTPYYNDTLKSQNIAVVDLDNSPLSKELIFLVNASPYVEVSSILNTQEEAILSLEDSKINGILTIHKDFEKDLYIGATPIVSVISNGSYFLIHSAISNAINDALNELSALYNKSQNVNKNLLELNVISLFNPSLGYLNYTLAPILLFILHQTLLAAIGIIGGKQRENIDEFMYLKNSKISHIILSKILVFGIIYIFLFMFYLGFGFMLYDISHIATLSSIMILNILFIFCTASFGVFFSSFITKEGHSTQIIAISSMPIVFALGFMWNEAQYPTLLNIIIKLIPAYHGINANLKLNQMGADIFNITPDLLSMLFLGLAYCVLSFFRFREMRLH